MYTRISGRPGQLDGSNRSIHLHARGYIHVARTRFGDLAVAYVRRYRAVSFSQTRIRTTF